MTLGRHWPDATAGRLGIALFAARRWRRRRSVATLIAGRLRLGLLTNGPPDIQRRKLAQSDLERSFEAVVVSGELGYGKPSHQDFAAVLERLGSGPERAVMIGDSWKRDVLGALGVGMRAFSLPHGRDVPEDLPDVVALDHLSALPALLGL